MEYRLWRKYCRKYISLIKISNQTCENELMEKHHIFPQSIFGKNKRITTLTPRQHFIAHKLLLKIFYFRNGLNSSRYHKMQKAFCWMQTRHYVKYNSRRYEFCKKMRSESMRGQNNPCKNSESFSPEHRKKISDALSRNHPFKGKKHSEEAKAKIREKRKLQVFSKEVIEKRVKNLRKKIMTPKGIFKSRNEAAKHYDIDASCFNYYMKTKPNEFYYIKNNE
jgi:hypothetical protein